LFSGIKAGSLTHRRRCRARDGSLPTLVNRSTSSLQGEKK
jgi:hypothetical protein